MTFVRKRKRYRLRRYILRVVVVGSATLLALLLSGFGYYLSLPSVGDAKAHVQQILHLHHGALGASPVPAKLGAAIVAVEDEHFYSNVALNVFDGAARAALASLHASGDPGGSTIAQQLAKQLYGGGTGFGETLQEIGLGVKLALSYSKPEILEMYLNAIYYGNGFWGCVAAARGYFHTTPNRLTWGEAAMLAGLPEAPSAFDPLQHLTLAKQRQRHVLDQLVVNHYLNSAQANAAYAMALPMRH